MLSSLKQGGVGEDLGIMNPTWPAHIDVHELTEMVHSTLKNDGVSAFPIAVVGRAF